MSRAAIRGALQSWLAGMSPALATAWENVEFTPAQGAPYQRVNLLAADPDNTTQGSAMFIEVGVLQVTLTYPAGSGYVAAEARAEAVRSRFKRGTTLTQDGVRVHITRTPSIAPAIQEPGWYSIPISIRWQAFITT